MFVFHFELPTNVSNGEDNQIPPTSGEMYIETENGYFPCIGWSDRLLPVVMQWIGNAIHILDAASGEQHVPHYFMDGPYSFDLQITERDNVTIQFMRHSWEGENREEMPFQTLALVDYSKALFDLTGKLINDPNFHWFGREKERDALRQSLPLLKAAMKRRQIDV
ncbi:MAG: hypothetical protein H0U76_17435 [Ktedonobacteraceae bacterium]|nr:hypothetical protein [Ktedonobacteraceae bacterium]